MTDKLIEAMSPMLRERHEELQKTNNELQQQMETLQQELDSLSNRKSILEDQLSLSQVGIMYRGISEMFYMRLIQATNTMNQQKR